MSSQDVALDLDDARCAIARLADDVSNGHVQVCAHAKRRGRAFVRSARDCARAQRMYADAAVADAESALRCVEAVVTKGANDSEFDGVERALERCERAARALEATVASR